VKKALVTGAAGGIGAAIAARLRADRLDVATLDRTPGCDHTVDLAVDPLPDLDDIDVCVSNAAILDTIAPAHAMTAQQWSGDIDVNLTGAFRVIQACLAGMRRRGGGRIIAISSGAARSGLPGQVAYSASKAGLIGMVKTLAAENAQLAITANAVLPGMVATERVKAMPQEIVARLNETLPTGRMADPVEVAALVAFLASDDAGYITGEAIAIDGGASLNTVALARRQR
jgi:acetoacetyl-CoA reductase